MERGIRLVLNATNIEGRRLVDVKELSIYSKLKGYYLIM
jgi:hypothetical protein